MTNKPPSGAPDTAPPGRLSISHFAAMKARGERIAMVTAYDAPSARLADAVARDHRDAKLVVGRHRLAGRRSGHFCRFSPREVATSSASNSWSSSSGIG